MMPKMRARRRPPGLDRLLAAVLVCVLASCEAATESAVRPQLPAFPWNSALVLVSLNDGVFGTRGEGLQQRMTPVYDTDWNTRVIVADVAKGLVDASGRQARIVQAQEITIGPDTRARSSDEAYAAVSRAMEAARGDFQTDIHLLIVPVPLDRYGKPKRFLQYFGAWGLLGILSHAMEEFRPAYVVRANDPISAIGRSKVKCLVSYSIVVLDARTHAIRAKLDDRIAYERLPDNFWIGDYTSLTTEDRQVLRNACVGAVSKWIARDLGALGLGEPTRVPRTG